MYLENSTPAWAQNNAPSSTWETLAYAYSRRRAL